MSWAFLFPGQGSQKVGMLTEWRTVYPQETDDLFAKVNRICSADLLRLALEGPEEELSMTANAQPIILATSFLIFELLRRHVSDEMVSVVAGHSLGEYSALCVAQSMSFEEAIFLVRKRGELMQEAMPKGTGAMVALIGLPMEGVETLVALLNQSGQGRVEIANLNSSDQVVLSLPKVLVSQTMERAKELGCKKAVELKVSAPFHSSYMEEAARRFLEVLNAISLRRPRYRYISNVTASYVEDPEEIKVLLARQMTSPVRWKEIMEVLYRGGYRRVVEVGPGMVLSKLFEREYPEGKVFSLHAPKNMQLFLSEVGKDGF